MNKRNTNNK